MTSVDELRARGAWDWKVSVCWRGPDRVIRQRHVLARYCRDPETAIGFARRILRPHALEILQVYRHQPTGSSGKHWFWRQIRDLLIIAESAWRAPRHPWERLLADYGKPGFLSWSGHYRGEGESHSRMWHFTCAGRARYYLDHSTWAQECPSCTAPVLQTSCPAGPYHHGNPESLCLLCGRWTRKRKVSFGHDVYEVRHRGQMLTGETATPDPEWVPAAEWRPANPLEAAAWRRLIATRPPERCRGEAWWPR